MAKKPSKNTAPASAPVPAPAPVPASALAHVPAPEVMEGSEAALREIVAATQSEAGFMLVDHFPAAMLTKMEAAGLIEMRAVEDGTAARATAEGMNYVAQVSVDTADNSSKSERPKKTRASSMNIQLDDNVPLPAKQRVGRQSVFPFDAMTVNQSFHIPVTEDKPEPWLSYSSTVSSASAKYAKPKLDATGKPITKTQTRTYKGEQRVYETTENEYERYFTIRRVGADDPKGPGARVFRVK